MEAQTSHKGHMFQSAPWIRENKDIKQKSAKSKHKDSKINWNFLVIPTDETTSCPTEHLLRGVSLSEKLPLTSDHSSVHLQLG